MSTNPQVKVVLDNIGRTILGEVVKQTESKLHLKNPVILNVVPQDAGKMSLQLFPLFFREFLGDKTEDVVFEYNLNSITSSSIEAIDFRLQAQYFQMFNKSNVFAQSQESSKASEKPSVVNLFDE